MVGSIQQRDQGTGVNDGFLAAFAHNQPAELPSGISYSEKDLVDRRSVPPAAALNPGKRFFSSRRAFGSGFVPDNPE